MDKPYFILQGNGSNRNRGCEAIMRGTVSLLREEMGPCGMICAPAGLGRPEDFHTGQPDIEYVLRQPTPRWTFPWWKAQFYRRLLRRMPPTEYYPFIPEAKAMLSLGGDNFSLDYGVPTAFFMDARRALRQGCPVIIWGASVGPFSAMPKFEKWAAEELKKQTLICARESRTVNYLASIGVRDNVRLVADPAFVMKPSQPMLTEQEAKILSSPCLGLNLSPLLHKFRDSERSWKLDAARYLRVLSQKVNIPIALIPHVDVPPGNSDYEFMSQVLNEAGDVRDNCVLFSRHYNAPEYKWILSKVTAFIGARTHATIAAISSCTPTASIAYSIKALGINSDVFGHTDWVLPSKSMTAESLEELASRLVRQGPEVRELLAKTMPAYIDRARDAARFLQQAIETK